MTLIELLTVAVIIGILAGILLPALTRARTKSKRVKAYGECRDLVKAWEAYYHTYTNWPASGLVDMTATRVQILQGVDEQHNPWKIRFMDFPPGAEAAGFRDPWGKLYRVRLPQSGASHEVEETWTYATRVYPSHERRALD
jgi:type II secretory pathway pseudopilin PulG